MKIYSDFGTNFEINKFPFLSTVYYSSRNYIQSTNSLFYDLKIPRQYQVFSPYNFLPESLRSLFNAQFIGIFQINPTFRRTYLDIQRGFAHSYSRRYIEFVLLKNYWSSKSGSFGAINKSGLFFRSFNFVGYFFNKFTFDREAYKGVQGMRLSSSTPSWVIRNRHKNIEKFKWPFFKAFGFILDARKFKRFWKKPHYMLRKPLLIYGFSGLYKIAANWFSRFDEVLLSFSDFKSYFRLLSLPNIKVFEKKQKFRKSFYRNKFIKLIKRRFKRSINISQLYTRFLLDQCLKILVFKFYFKFIRFSGLFRHYIARFSKYLGSLKKTYKLNYKFFKINSNLLFKLYKNSYKVLFGGFFLEDFFRLKIFLGNIYLKNHLPFKTAGYNVIDIEFFMQMHARRISRILLIKGFISNGFGLQGAVGSTCFDPLIIERFKAFSTFSFSKSASIMMSSTLIAKFPCGFKFYNVLNPTSPSYFDGQVYLIF